jgi:hypothetical protein
MSTEVRPEARLCRPFWLQLEASPGGSARFRVPDGWVIRDLSINFNSTNYLRLQASTDRDLNQFIPVSATDLENGILPFYYDYSMAGASWYASSSVIWEWHDIQYAELRCVFIDVDALEYYDKVVQVGGVLVPDPRRFR